MENLRGQLNACLICVTKSKNNRVVQDSSNRIVLLPISGFDDDVLFLTAYCILHIDIDTDIDIDIDVLCYCIT